MAGKKALTSESFRAAGTRRKSAHGRFSQISRPERIAKEYRQGIQKAVGTRITAMRKAKGLPQDVLARRCGISPATLGEIERGHQNFRVDTVLSIANGLETSVTDLLTGIA